MSSNASPTLLINKERLGSVQQGEPSYPDAPSSQAQRARGRKCTRSCRTRLRLRGTSRDREVEEAVKLTLHVTMKNGSLHRMKDKVFEFGETLPQESCIQRPSRT